MSDRRCVSSIVPVAVTASDIRLILNHLGNFQDSYTPEIRRLRRILKTAIGEEISNSEKTNHLKILHLYQR